MQSQTISERIDSFVSYKRSLGYIYSTQGIVLKRYKQHMEKGYPNLSIPDKESTDRYLEKHQGHPGGLHNVICSLREFSRYLHLLGYENAYLIPPKQMPKAHPKPPYFFTEKEISLFFVDCDVFFSERIISPLTNLVVPVVLRVLYCCGLRPKEARTLLNQNVNLLEKYIDVIQSKGPKSRRIYISDELASYLLCYDQQVRVICPNRNHFFPKDCENSYSLAFLVVTLREFGKCHTRTPPEHRLCTTSDITLLGST